MKHYFLRLNILVPGIVAGIGLLTYILGGQISQNYTETNSWAFRFWGLVITLGSGLIGYLITRFILNPVQSFVQRAQHLTNISTEQTDEYTQESSGANNHKKPSQPRSEVEFYSQVFDQVTDLLTKLEAQNQFPEIIGSSQAMRSALSQAAKVSPTQATVLLLGESGTGKELLASAIHAKSDRSKAPFLAINCMSIPKDLLESELFGHEKGAFTGAHQSRKGKFEEADQGTLFLDEIGDMPLEVQGKILRVLQDQSFQRVGGNKTIQANVRIIAATNKNLDHMVQEETFRQDLYYRLKVFSITLPPLRQRKEDIPLLAEYFLHQENPSAQISPQAMHLLMAWDWPGNIRELQNTIQRAAILAEDSPIQAQHLPQEMNLGLNETQQEQVSQNQNLDERLIVLEKSFIQQALKQAKGVQAQAAEILGIKPRSLWHRIKKYEIDVEQFKE